MIQGVKSNHLLEQEIEMAKYYVQSGNVSCVVTAADAEGAALWVLNRTIDAWIPIDDIRQRLISDQTLATFIFGFSNLGQVFNISEIGIGRDEVAKFETDELFDTWRSLQRAMQHLFDQLG